MKKILLVIFSLVCTGLFGGQFDEWIKQDKLSRVWYKKFSTEIAKSHNLILLCGDGIGSIIDDKNTTWCSKYMIHGHPFTIEELRPIVLSAVSYLWQNVRKEPSFNNYVAYELKFKKKPILPVSMDHIGMRIDLWDENTNRYLYPNVSKVILNDGHLYYYYADPKTQALQEPIKEKLPAWVIE